MSMSKILDLSSSAVHAQRRLFHHSAAGRDGQTAFDSVLQQNLALTAGAAQTRGAPEAAASPQPLAAMISAARAHTAGAPPVFEARAAAVPRHPLLDQPLPDPGRDFRREPLTVRELSVVRAHRAAGLEVPDYPPPAADLGATDYADPAARESALASLRAQGWDTIAEADLDWERMQVRSNSRRRLSEDHLGRTVLQYRAAGGWQNAGDIRAFDGLGGIFRPELQAASGGELAVFGPHADPDQIREIIANDWIPSFFDGSRFYPHERPTYRDDGSLISGGEHNPDHYANRVAHLDPALPIRGDAELTGQRQEQPDDTAG